MQCLASVILREVPIREWQKNAYVTFAIQQAWKAEIDEAIIRSVLSTITCIMHSPRNACARLLVNIAFHSSSQSFTTLKKKKNCRYDQFLLTS